MKQLLVNSFAVLCLVAASMPKLVLASEVALENLKLDHEEVIEANLDLATKTTSVISGNFPNAVMDGNFPNAVMSGNFPDAVMSGNFPTSNPPVTTGSLNHVSRPLSMNEINASATLPSPQ